MTPQAASGVVLAQGGQQRGYALALKDGKPVFYVREANKLFTAAALTAPKGRFSLEARLDTSGAMTLRVNGTVAAHAKAPGVIAVQPEDPLSIGKDVLTAVGDYAPPHPLKGTVENVEITAGTRTYRPGKTTAALLPKALEKKVGMDEAND